MSRLIFTFIAILLFLLPAMVSAVGEFTVIIHVLNREKLQTLYLSDLNFLREGEAEELFYVQIIRNTGDAYDRCMLNLKVLKNEELLASAGSNTFKIPARPAGTIYETNNVVLLNDQFYFHPKDDPGQPDPGSRVRITQSEIDESVNEILASGKAPIGVYKLVLEIHDLTEGTNLVTEEVLLLRATNPSFVMLSTPGMPSGMVSDADIYSEYPVFQWHGNGEEYQALVFEKKNTLQSVEDVIRGIPNWESERTQALSLQYPQAGMEFRPVIPLEYGKTYYWMVKMFRQTSAGEEVINSEIWQFTLNDPTRLSNSQGAEAKAELIIFLRDLLGHRADEVIKSIKNRQLRSIILNGREIELSDLYRKIEQYREQDVEITDLILPAKY